MLSPRLSSPMATKATPATMQVMSSRTAPYRKTHGRLVTARSRRDRRRTTPLPGGCVPGRVLRGQ